jgi:hypothetical protein
MRHFLYTISLCQWSNYAQQESVEVIFRVPVTTTQLDADGCVAGADLQRCVRRQCRRCEAHRRLYHCAMSLTDGEVAPSWSHWLVNVHPEYEAGTSRTI